MDMSSATSTAENGLKRKYSELQQLQIIVEDSEEEILLTSYRNNEAQGTEGADAVPRTGWYREINKDKQILGSTGFHPRPTSVPFFRFYLYLFASCSLSSAAISKNLPY